MSLTRVECFNLGFIFVGTVLTFVPLFRGNDEETIGLQDDAFFATSCLYRFAITFVESIDILWDIIGGIDSWFRTGTMGSGSASGEMKLKNYERGIFIMGIGIIAVVIYAPTANRALLYDCTANASMILTICPVIPFLTRCTTTWNSFHVVSTTVFIVLGAVLDSLSLLYSPLSAPRARLGAASVAFTVIAAGVMFFTCVVCAWRSHLRYFFMNQVGLDEAQGVVDMLNNSAHGHNKEGHSGTTTVHDRLLNNFIPAGHMCGSFMFAVIHIWSDYEHHNEYFSGVYNYIHVVIGVFVLVSEFRLRKNEAARGIVAVIESRKAYVR